MNRQIPQKQSILKIIRIFLAQYLATVHNIKSFQNEALNMLALYVLSIIKKLAIQSKKITHMQGRTETNSLHLLAAVEIHRHFKLQKFAHFYSKYKESNYFNHMYFEKLYSDIFENDLEVVNQYQKETRFSNILYTRPHYTAQPLNRILPFKASIEQSFQFPQEFSYRQTQQPIKRQKKEIENLRTYTTRQNRKAIGMTMKEDIQQQKPIKEFVQQHKQKKVNTFDIIGNL